MTQPSPSTRSIAPVQQLDRLPPDAELVARATSGDRWAVDALYRRHAPSILRVLLRLLGRRADAEDALHDAILITMKRLDELRDPSLVAGWMTRIAINEAKKRLRRRALLQRIGMRSSADASLDALAGPGSTPETIAFLAEVSAILHTLPVNDRIAWTLRYVEGYRLEELAALVDVSLATLKRRLARAEGRLGALVRFDETDEMRTTDEPDASPEASS